MKYSEIKQVKAFCEDLFSQPDWREVIENIESGEADFEVDGVRFISDEGIDEIMQDELSSDESILGCFNSRFISIILGVRESVIKDIQEAEAFEAIGRWIIDSNKLEKLQQKYVEADGYGHHFNYYDGNEEELTIGKYDETGYLFYHVFDNR